MNASAPSVADTISPQRGGRGRVTQHVENPVCEVVAGFENGERFLVDFRASVIRVSNRFLETVSNARDAYVTDLGRLIETAREARKAWVGVNRALSATSADPYAAQEAVRIETVAALVRVTESMRSVRNLRGATEQAFRDEMLLVALAHNTCSHPDSHYGLCPPDETHAEPFYFCDLCRNSWEPGESRDDEAVA